MAILIAIGAIFWGIFFGFSNGVMFTILLMIPLLFLESLFYGSADRRYSTADKKHSTEGISDRHIDACRQQESRARDSYYRNH